MGDRQRYLRTLALFALMALYSVALLGHTDDRLNIGGFDFDFEIYVQDEDEQDIDENFNAIKEEEWEVLDAISGTVGFALSSDIKPELAKAGENVISVENVEEVLAKVSADQIPVIESPVPEKEREKPPILVHKVRAGETLWDIARAYGITVDSILSANTIANSNRIRVGQELQILTVKGVLHKVAYGESVWEIAERYGVSMNEIVKANHITDASRIQPSDQLVIPGATQLLIKDVLVVNGQLQKAFEWPAKARISSPFGPRWGGMHNGIDVAVVTGTPVKAAADGKVIYSGVNGGYGIMVMIDHGNGVETRYAHHSRNIVSVGQTVQRGQVIAYSGNTGNSTGPHLHFEIRYRRQPVDPMLYLK